MRFTLKQLSYFIAAGEARSITLASERVHISPPSISSAISQLESEFGVQLFFRHHAQGMSLTPAGERFLIAARDLLGHAQRLHDLAHDITSSVAGPLRVGTFRTFAPLIMPALFKDFLDQHPQVQMQFFEDDEFELVSKVRRAELDIAITYEQEGIDLQFERLALLPTYLLLSASHPMATSESLSLAELADQPFVLLDLPVSREYFQSLFDRLGLRMNVIARSAQPETVRSFVASGLGFSMLTSRPASRIASNGGKLAYVPMSDDTPPMKLGLVTAKNIRKTRAILAFEDHCRRRISTNDIPGMAPL